MVLIFFFRIIKNFVEKTRHMCVEYFIRYLPCQRADRTIIRNEITPIITSRWNKRLIFDAISLGQYANEIYIFQYISKKMIVSVNGVELVKHKIKVQSLF